MANVQMPWSIKGVSDEARQIAREQAQAAGITMGAWLSDLIVAAAIEDMAANTHLPQQADPATPQKSISVTQKSDGRATGEHNMMESELAQLVLTIAKRVATLEKDTASFAASFQDQLSLFRKSLQSLEASRAIPATVRSSVTA